MKKSKQFFAIFIIMLLSSFVITSILFAQTHIPPGNVSGTWTIDGSPYIIDGNIKVPVDNTLVIEPGVNIIFSDQYSFKVYGRLLAEGTVNDTIYFTVQNTINDYAGIYFYDTDISMQDSSKVEYCKFDPGFISFFNSSNIIFTNSVLINGAGVFCSEASPILTDLLICNNTTDYYGGGIYCTDGSNPSLVNVTISGNNPDGICCSHNSNPTLEQVTIADNLGVGVGCIDSSSPIINNVTISGNEGGGIACSNNSNPILEDVTISNNNVWGGIFCTNSSPILNNVIISGNSGYEGGGIYFEGTGTLLLQDVIITGNSALGMGGGVAVLGADMIMVNGIVADNHAGDAGGIYCYNGVSISLTNVTVCENSVDDGGIVGGIGCEFDCILNITNSIVWNNDPMDIFLYGFGCESDITYSDIGGSGWQGVGNINTNPLFADTFYHLSEDSPCIDAGNPDTMYYDIEDPDNPGFALYPAMGTLHNDMGAYGGHGKYEPILSTDDPPHSQFMTINNYPNPFTSSTVIQYTLPQNIREAEIEIYNIKGQLVKTLLTFPNRGLGTSTAVWDGKDDRGKEVGAGIYFYKLTADKKETIKKMVLIRLR